MSTAPRKHLLGWDRPPLAAAAEWLHVNEGEDMAALSVALPGAQAGRRLRELLARRIGAAWRPPRILTTGQLVDALLEVEGRPAGRLVRTLAWGQALRGLSPAERRRIAAHVPEDHDLAGWLRLAEEVRALFGELAAEGRDFHALASGPARPEIVGEAARWEALAAAQEDMVSRLARAELVDPHLGRLAALDAGRIDTEARVVLVGVVDMNALLRRTLAGLGDRVTSLLPAPADRADDFDELGCLRVERWAEGDVPLTLDGWRVADKPEDQAAAAIRALADWSGRFAAEDITVGVADTEVVPYLRQRLAAQGITARDVAGLPLPRTAPARLLEAASHFLSRSRFADFAALVRHPDLARLLPDDAPTRLDAYQAEHLPAAVAVHGKGEWLGKDQDAAGMAAVHDALRETLGDLAQDEARSLGDWAPAVRAFLTAVYERTGDENGADRDTRHALGELGDALVRLEDVPPVLSPSVPAAAALELLLRTVRARAVPPPPAGANEPTIELLGWLELALDDAPALVITGFQDGFVPEAVHGDAYLPDGLRRQLELDDNDRRLARDVFAAHVLLHAREEAVFVTGRRSAAGDPHKPSRLAFHRPEAEIVERVRHYLPREDARPAIAAATDEGSATYDLPRLVNTPEKTRFSVTSFRRYLESPYLFYLEHVLRLGTLDDRAREMDPLGFGNLAHEVLCAFGRSKAKDSPDAGRIAKFLRAELRRQALAKFGADPLPAVALQLDQLAHRLAIFAERQAEHAAQGWRILHCEWKPKGGTVPFEAKGHQVELSGQIDRIDQHADGRFAIWDYKTGETVKEPEKTHRKGTKKNREWVDLQLPLYTVVAHEVVGDAQPELGYAALGKDDDNVGFLPATSWTPQDIEYAIEMARDVVVAVREGRLRELGRPRLHDDVFRAICGQGLIAEPGDFDGEGEE